MAIVRYQFDPANPPKMTEAERQFLDNLTPEQIEQNALDDPDNPPFTDEELERLSIAAPIQRARRGMGLTQVQFSERFHINLARLRDWEQGRYKPDSALLAYLKIIAAEPDLGSRILDQGAADEKASAAE